MSDDKGTSEVNGMEWSDHYKSSYKANSPIKIQISQVIYSRCHFKIFKKQTGAVAESL